MLRTAFVAALALVVLASSAVDRAEARARAPSFICDNVDVMRPCRAVIAPPRPVARARVRRKGTHIRARRTAVVASQVSPVGLVTPLAAKVDEISAACGSVLISGVRHTLVHGTRRVSLHWSGRAADLKGNPACIYSRLQGWQGGYSTDYAAVGHVHVSWDPERRREWGVRFAHRRSRHVGHHRLARAGS